MPRSSIGSRRALLERIHRRAIALQRALNRREHRNKFRRIAKDMANRYLSQMQQFSSRKLENLAALLSDDSAHLTASRVRELETAVNGSQRNLQISDDRRKAIHAQVEAYAGAQSHLGPDDKLAIERIMLNRYARRIPQGVLFGTDPEPSKPLTIGTDVCEAARVHLLHEYDRAFYFGIDDLCDAASENAEQFLRMAAILVDALSVRLIRSKPPYLTAAEQHELLRKRANEFIRDWNFPRFELVKALVDYIAERCVAVSLSPNAWIGPGANAFGVPQQEFDEISKNHPDLARILQYAVAYNAVSLVPKYECKGQMWCLLELGGIVILDRGLTLRRGGFIEGSVAELDTVTRSSRG